MDKTVSHNPKKMLFAVSLILVVACGCHTFNEYYSIPNDGPLEQLSEAVLESIIEKQTGIEIYIDLTPEG